MAAKLKQCISDPKLVKPTCVWEVVDILKNGKQTAENSTQMFQNLKIFTASQTHFDFTNIGSEMHHFSSTSIYFSWFSIGTSCMCSFSKSL